MKVKYSEEDMAALISEVETQFAESLAKAEEEKAELAKSEETVVTEPVVETAPAATYDEEDMNEMNRLYSSMSKSEAELHYQAVKKAVFGDVIEKSEKAVVEVKPVEVKAVEVKTVEKADLTKSEEFIALKKENDDLKKSLEQLVASLTKNIKSAPARKAVTQLSEIDYIKKSEKETVNINEIDVTKLSKNEISRKFSEKIREGKLSKTERDQIDGYCLGTVKLDEVKHLLQK
jgi:hypothetical protein